MKLLLINPNTSPHVTDRMVVQARRTAGSRASVDGVTAAFGPAIIGSKAENAIATHGALDTAARHHAGYDAVILGVSMDSGLAALRELFPIPVVGMAEASILLACSLGAACSASHLPRPPISPQFPEDFLPVTEPAPAPRAQAIPARPNPNAVWIDGEWVPAGPRWRWQPGGWATPPAGATLALHQSSWQSDGSLRHAPSVFHLRDGSRLTVASVLGLGSELDASQPFCAASGAASAAPASSIAPVACK